MKYLFLMIISLVSLAVQSYAVEDHAMMTRKLTCESGDMVARVTRSAVSGTGVSYYLLVPPDYAASTLNYRDRYGDWYCSRGSVKFNSNFDQAIVIYNDGTKTNCR